MYFKVIQPREYALLGHAQAAREHRHKQAVVGLQRRAEHRADDVYHLRVISMMERLVQRHVVFVYYQYCLLAVVLFQQTAKHF